MDDFVFKGTQLSLLKAEHEKKLDFVLSSLIYDLAHYLDPKNGLSSRHISDLVEIIKSDYWMMKIEEIAYVFKAAKKGETVTVFNLETEKEYNRPFMDEIYGQISPKHIIDCLNRWVNSVTKLNYIHKQNKHKEPDEKEIDSEVKQKLNSMIKRPNE